MENKIHTDILNACEEIAEKNEVKALCIYGSRVSGYAREDSDYDILLTLKDYSDVVRESSFRLSSISSK